MLIHPRLKGRSQNSCHENKSVKRGWFYQNPVDNQDVLRGLNPNNRHAKDLAMKQETVG